MYRGDMVLVDWPYSDLKGSKLRPAVVVQADFLNGIIDDTIFVQITRTRHGLPGTEVEIGPAQETYAGLSKVSYVNCTTILTRDQALIGQVIGYLSDAAMQLVNGCLKQIMALP